MKIKITALLLVLTMLCALSLASCDIADVLGSVGDVDLESAVDLLNDENVFKGYVLADDVPYELEYTSNGDGTCAVTGVKINSKYFKEYIFEIPERSPEGDTVTSIAWGRTFEKITHNTPRFLTVETMNSLVEKMENQTDTQAVFSFKKFQAYYALQDPTAEGISDTLRSEMLNAYPIVEYMPLYVLDPDVSLSECAFISTFLNERIEHCAVKEFAKISAAVLGKGVGEEQIAEYYGEDFLPNYGHYVTNITGFIYPSTLTEITDGSLDGFCAPCDFELLPKEIHPEIMLMYLKSSTHLSVYCELTEAPDTWSDKDIFEYQERNVRVYWYSETCPEDPHVAINSWHYVDEKPVVWSTFIPSNPQNAPSGADPYSAID